jgi:pimeloyl-ACP methyl ester carboxylesterase
MTTWQSGDIKANRLTLHYTRTGGAKPPVVLAHGFSDDGLCWTPIAEVLATDYDVVMVDGRGHGRSDAPKRGYGSAEHAADLAGVITGLGLKRPAVLGHSMGAATALVFAGAYPDLPRAILLEDPPPWWVAPPPGAPARRPARFGDWIIELKRKTREEMIAMAHAQSPTWAEAELGPWADAKLRLSFNVLRRSKSAPVDWPATVRQITCPALLITADPEKGAIVKPENAAALQTLVPQMRVVHIPGAGHNIRREQFARYMEVVKSFLADTGG